MKKTNEDQVVNKIIEKLPKNNDKYYIKRLNTFVLREHKKQQEQSDLFTIILNIKRKLTKAKNKANIAKLKSLKRQSLKMLKDLGEEYVEI